jgi:hypothetical protein
MTFRKMDPSPPSGDGKRERERQTDRQTDNTLLGPLERDNFNESSDPTETNNQKKTLWLFVHMRTVPTERPSRPEKLIPTLVNRGASRDQRSESQLQSSRFSRQKLLVVISISSSIILTRSSGFHPRHTAAQKIWQSRESNPGPLTTRPQ